MSTSDKPAPNLVIPWPWILPLLVGLAGGGAGGTLLSRPVMASPADLAPPVTREEIEGIIDMKFREHDAYLLQKIELLLAREKLANSAP